MRRVAHLETSLLAQMVASELPAPARLVLLAMICSPDTTDLGVFGSGSDRLAAVTGQPAASVRSALDALWVAGFIVHDPSTGESFCPAVIAGADAARHASLVTPLNAWWHESGFDWDPELRQLPIASAAVRGAVVGALRRVAT